MNNYYTNIVESLNILKFEGLATSCHDSILAAIETYKNHPSICRIKIKFGNSLKFSFSEVAREEILKFINDLDNNTGVQETDIPTRIIKEHNEFLSDFLTSSVNDMFKTGCFPEVLKRANITPVFKKGPKLLKENYQPISILPNISKLFERPIFNQMSSFFNEVLSNFQCGFRKGFNTQHCLVAMIEKVENKQ